MGTSALVSTKSRPRTHTQISLQEQRHSPAMALPDIMIGHFQMESSVGFNDLMYELGVNFVTRNLANNLYPLQKISQQDGQIYIDTETSFRCTAKICTWRGLAGDHG